jgi:hypothetical protein
MYILKLFLDVISAGIEALVSTFLHACVKEVIRLWAQSHFDTFLQLIIVEVP